MYLWLLNLNAKQLNILKANAKPNAIVGCDWCIRVLRSEK
jgi:hypothetical protein